jgi:dTMP kinase
MPGFFITFEGSEGCGKTTQIERLARRLAGIDVGREALVLREPGGTPLGEEVRGLLKRAAPGWSIEPEAELLLFAASRAQLVRATIAPALTAGRVVICDRFLDSTTVYQGVARRLDPALVAAINEFAAGARRPDVTFLLDIPAHLALERARRRESAQGQVPDRMELEPPAFYEQVRNGYLRVAQESADRFVIIDASRSIDEIETLVWQHLATRLHGLRTRDCA